MAGIHNHVKSPNLIVSSTPEYHYTKKLVTLFHIHNLYWLLVVRPSQLPALLGIMGPTTPKKTERKKDTTIKRRSVKYGVKKTKNIWSLESASKRFLGRGFNPRQPRPCAMRRNNSDAVGKTTALGGGTTTRRQTTRTITAETTTTTTSSANRRDTHHHHQEATTRNSCKPGGGLSSTATDRKQMVARKTFRPAIIFTASTSPTSTMIADTTSPVTPPPAAGPRGTGGDSSQMMVLQRRVDDLTTALTRERQENNNTAYRHAYEKDHLECNTSQSLEQLRKEHREDLKAVNANLTAMKSKMKYIIKCLPPQGGTLTKAELELLLEKERRRRPRINQASPKNRPTNTTPRTLVLAAVGLVQEEEEEVQEKKQEDEPPHKHYYTQGWQEETELSEKDYGQEEGADDQEDNDDEINWYQPSYGHGEEEEDGKPYARDDERD